jgi:hypothetical protein
MKDSQKGQEVFEWSGQGYSPLVFSHDWQVALLNWEPIFDLDKMGEIERHINTDEVFVLIKGRALLFTLDEEGIQVSDMQSGAIYNVVKGAWHNLISSRDATWIIVENRGTHLTDTETRNLTREEKSEILDGLPEWVLTLG